jgi:hypothetical protein
MVKMEEKKSVGELKIIAAIFLASYFISFLFLYVNIKKIDGSKKMDKLEIQNQLLIKQLDSLNQENKTISISLSLMDKKIDSLGNTDANFKNLFNENENKIKLLQKKYNNVRIDTFTSNDIKKFFSNYR